MSRRTIIITIAILFIFITGFIGGIVFQRYDWLAILKNSTNAPTPTETPIDNSPLEGTLKRALDIPADKNFTLNELGFERQQQFSRNDRIWLGEQFNEDVCNDLSDWNLDYELDTWDEQTAPYYDTFLEDGLGGYFPPSENINLQFREQVQETDTYTVDYIVTDTRKGDTSAHAYLMIPKAPPSDENGYPVIILLHASNNLIESVVGLYDGKDRTNTAGVRWVERGAIVLAIDGNDNPAGDIMRTSQFVNRNGYFLMIQRVHSMIDWLTQQGDIPIHRIGTYGISYGGYMSFWTGITDDRIDVVAANGFARDFTQWIFENPTTAPEPMLRGWFEYMDWCRWETSTQARFIAPRRLLLEVGINDKSTLIGDFTEPRTAQNSVDTYVFDLMADRIQETYDNLGIDDRFYTVKFEGGHEMLSEETEDWIYEQLTRPVDVP